MPRLTQVAGIGKSPSVTAFVDPTMVVGGDTTTGPVNEGATIQIQILTTGIPNGATISYSADPGNSVSVADISLSSLNTNSASKIENFPPSLYSFSHFLNRSTASPETDT